MAIQTTKDGNIKFRRYTKYGDVSPRPTGAKLKEELEPRPREYEAQQPLEKPTGPVANKHVETIALSIATEIQRQVDQRVKDILEEGGKDEWLAWFQGEVEHWKQRAEELEIELECMRNAFPEDDHDVLPKYRGIFGA
jgi:hypothetical protein